MPVGQTDEKGNRCESGATAITVFGEYRNKAIERELEKAFLFSVTAISHESGDLPQDVTERFWAIGKLCVTKMQCNFAVVDSRPALRSGAFFCAQLSV